MSRGRSGLTFVGDGLEKWKGSLGQAALGGAELLKVGAENAAESVCG